MSAGAGLLWVSAKIEIILFGSGQKKTYGGVAARNQRQPGTGVPPFAH